MPGATSLKMPKRRIEDSDDEFPIFAERRAKKLFENNARLEDSDDDNTPLFGPNGLAEKIRQQEEEQE